MLPKDLLKDYLTFTKSERIFAIIVVFIIGGSIVLPRFLATAPPPLPVQSNKALVLAMDTLHERQHRKPSFRSEDRHRADPYERSAANSYTEGKLFPFDPNTITADEWQQLGLNKRTSKTISNYINKGGRFYKPEDLQRIWGMPQGFYERVKSYVRINAVKKEYPSSGENKPAFVREERKPAMININDADTTTLISLPGIGSRLSARIVAFREKLGGFYSVEQLGETYGLPDSTFQRIKNRLQVDESNIRKINVNTATKEELKAHPYIRWNLANALVEYRNQHGTFKQLEDVKNIVLVDEETYQKISHYLALE